MVFRSISARSAAAQSRKMVAARTCTAACASTLGAGPAALRATTGFIKYRAMVFSAIALML